MMTRSAPRSVRERTLSHAAMRCPEPLRTYRRLTRRSLCHSLCFFSVFLYLLERCQMLYNILILQKYAGGDRVRTHGMPPVRIPSSRGKTQVLCKV